MMITPRAFVAAALELLLACSVSVVIVRAFGQEKITLAAAVFVDTGAAEFRPSSLYINRQGHEIRAILSEVNSGTAVFKPNGRTLPCSYADAAADTLITQLNVMNFSTTSLEKRIMLTCQADGKLPTGTITGTPQ